MVPGLKLENGEKQVSKPLVVSCRLRQAHAFGYNVYNDYQDCLAYIYIDNIYIIKYKSCEQMLCSWM